MKVISLLPLIPALCHAFPTWGPPNGWQHQPKGGWGHQPKGGWSGGSKAAYFLRVDPSGSTVVAIELESNGLLSSTTTSTSTGGVGLQTQNYTNNDAPTTIDPLSSQQAVSVGDDVRECALAFIMDTLVTRCSIYSPSTPVPIQQSCSRSILPIL